MWTGPALPLQPEVFVALPPEVFTVIVSMLFQSPALPGQAAKVPERSMFFSLVPLVSVARLLSTQKAVAEHADIIWQSAADSFLYPLVQGYVPVLLNPFKVSAKDKVPVMKRIAQKLQDVHLALAGWSTTRPCNYVGRQFECWFDPPPLLPIPQSTCEHRSTMRLPGCDGSGYASCGSTDWDQELAPLRWGSIDWELRDREPDEPTEAYEPLEYTQLTRPLQFEMPPLPRDVARSIDCRPSFDLGGFITALTLPHNVPPTDLISCNYTFAVDYNGLLLFIRHAIPNAMPGLIDVHGYGSCGWFLLSDELLLPQDQLLCPCDEFNQTLLDEAQEIDDEDAHEDAFSWSTREIILSHATRKPAP